MMTIATITHRHRAKTAVATSYVGQTPTGVTTQVPDEARGGLVTTSTCACGAVKVDLANGPHRARGRWVAP